jgi:hypothetical protein
MKAGNFNSLDYLNKLYEAAEGNTDKGYLTSTPADGLLLPEDTKKSFDWLNKEYQKGKTEVKVEIKGEGSSFKPGYDLQTDLKSVKDFKPGMFGDVKTEDTASKGENNKPASKTEEPKSPKNKKEETTAEDTDPKNAKEAKSDTAKKPNVAPKAQQMQINVKSKKNDK